MTAFSAANVAKALERVPLSGNKELKSLVQRAQAQGLIELVTAIEAELNARGPVDFTPATALQHAKWSEQVKDLSLQITIEVAFSTLPLSIAEFKILKAISENSGVTYEQLKAYHGKGNVGLILGHFVQNRLGFFRRHIVGLKNHSDIFFLRGKVAGGTSYSLTAEARNAFLTLEVIC